MKFIRGYRSGGEEQVTGMRILLVEDEVDLAEALAAFLEKYQFLVDMVHDGAQGYDYAAGTPVRGYRAGLRHRHPALRGSDSAAERPGWMYIRVAKCTIS